MPTLSGEQARIYKRLSEKGANFGVDHKRNAKGTIFFELILNIIL